MSKKTRQIHRIWLVIALALVTYFASHYHVDNASQPTDKPVTVEQLFADHQSNQQVTLYGKVSRLLPDDTDGHPHQRFIVTLPSGQTVLIAHNIELAPRLEDLQLGDEIAVFGEYEWNDKGGVVHWTHHDPDNHHPHGWIRWHNELYQ